MNADNNKLGRGLGSLLSPGSQKEDKKFKFINITEIHANKDQPRESFKKEELEELANSIKSLSASYSDRFKISLCLITCKPSFKYNLHFKSYESLG